MVSPLFCDEKVLAHKSGDSMMKNPKTTRNRIWDVLSISCLFLRLCVWIQSCQSQLLWTWLLDISSYFFMIFQIVELLLMVILSR